jgi:Rrf2 family protein
MIHQKTTQYAIAAISRLAELYHDPTQVASSRQIAESRNLPVPVVAKILTELSRGGLITGSPGPGGGYRLARPPEEISLKAVSDLFERDPGSFCPFGPGWCGHHDPCPLHASILAMQHSMNKYLESTTFAGFAKKDGKKKSAKTP